MNSTLLQKLLAQPETIKLEFKQAYHLASKADNNSNQNDWKRYIDGQWDELIKDIISLANGNIGGAGQEGILIIGANNEFVKGKREIYDTKDIKLTENQLLQKVNSVCQPPIQKIILKRIKLKNKSIIVITIPPTPYIHETNRQLRMVTGKVDSKDKLILTNNDKVYSEYSAFIRKGENIGIASWIDREGIAKDKKFLAISFSENIKREITENIQVMVCKIQGTIFDPFVSLDIIKENKISSREENFYTNKDWFLHISILYFNVIATFRGITTRFLDEAIISRCYEEFDETTGQLSFSPFLDNLIQLQKSINRFIFQYRLLEDLSSKVVTKFSPKLHPNPELIIPVLEIAPIVSMIYRFGDVLILSKAILKYLLNQKKDFDKIQLYPQSPFSNELTKIENEKISYEEAITWVMT